MFTVTIETTNAAFEGDPRREIAGILRRLANDLANGAHTYIIRDINGNTVGKAGFGR